MDKTPVSPAAAADESKNVELQKLETLRKCATEIQSVADRNSDLFQQLIDSELPEDLAKNDELLREVNANRSRSASLKSDLSATLSAIARQKYPSADGTDKKGESSSNPQKD